MNEKQRKALIETWIAKEELPASPGLKPIRKLTDGLYPEDEIERQAYWDFVSWTLKKEHQTLFSIPTNASDGFCKLNLDEDGDDISAFNTIDYHRKNPFNIYAWKVKKMCEKARDLAQTYSILQNANARLRTLKRFVNFAKSQNLKHQNLLWSIWRNHACPK